jgi:hypothetical protein
VSGPIPQPQVCQKECQPYMSDGQDLDRNKQQAVPSQLSKNRQPVRRIEKSRLNVARKWNPAVDGRIPFRKPARPDRFVNVIQQRLMITLDIRPEMGALGRRQIFYKEQPYAHE